MKYRVTWGRTLINTENLSEIKYSQTNEDYKFIYVFIGARKHLVDLTDRKDPVSL